MFDWNDEELANIVWGEAGDSDDHIVPYQKGSEDYENKEWSHEDSVRQAGQNTHGNKNEAHGRKLDTDSNNSTNKGMAASGFSMDSWPKLSLSNATKTGQNGMATEVSKNMNETTKYGSSGETAELVSELEVFETPHKSKEQGDFVDDGWANIGSFDDFDRIFSNDDQIFGNASLGNADELWSPSKHVSDSPVKSFPISVDSPDLGLGTLRNTSEHLGIKTEYTLDDESFTLGCGKMDDPAYHGAQNSNAIIDHLEYAGDQNKPMLEQTDSGVVGKTSVEKSYLTSQNVVTQNEFADKIYSNRRRKLLKSLNSEEISGGKVLQGLYDGWPSPVNTFGQFKKQLAPSIVQSQTPLILSHQKQLQGPESLHYQHVSNQFVPMSACGNLTQPCPTMSMPSQMQSQELNHQPLLYGYGTSPVKAISVNKSADTSVKHQTMTPQEKIEKLRRRQQMQAMLAIKKQQQQFNHQTSSTDNCNTQNCPQDNQTQHMEGADLEVEDLSNLPSLDPGSAIERDDSNAISVAADGYSWEEIILNQLQDTVAKLDMRIRLCIRDSLFRLGQSAVQRQYASETSSTSKSSRDEHGTVGKQEINNRSRYARMPDAETKTNHIDRTVAHLLFHRNLEMPESPASTKLPCDHKSRGPKNLAMGCLPENSEVKQSFPHQRSQDPCPLAEPQHVDQFQSSFCLETSENASITGPADGETMEIEASP